MITKDRQSNAFETLGKEFNYKNVHQSPKLLKVVISTGVGKADKNRKQMIAGRLAQITGQKPAPRQAKQSIAQFKMRQGDVIGYQVTLRGTRMYEFVDKLVHIALPRTRDFRGLNPKAIDEMGNLTLGIREHTIFPETSEEDLKDVFGIAITFVTTAHDKKEAEAFYRHIGIPLRES